MLAQPMLTIHTGENSIIVVLGANEHLSVEDVDKAKVRKTSMSIEMWDV